MPLIIGLIIKSIITFLLYGGYILLITFILWMAIDASKQDRYWWAVIIIGVPIIGAILYYVTEKKHTYEKVPSRHVHTSETEVQHEKTPQEHHH